MLGRPHHPDRPYSDPRVTIHLDDGRSFVRKTDRDLRPDQLRGRRFAGPALELLEHPPGELPVHRGGVPRHQGQAQARRRLRHVQLLPPGLGRGPAGETGREGLRHQAPGDLAAVSGRDRSDQRPARLHHVPAGRQRHVDGRRRDPGAVRDGRVLLAVSDQPRLNEPLERLRPDAAPALRCAAGEVQQDRARPRSS